jgi:hypothetical protein
MRIIALFLAMVVCLGTNALAWVQESTGNVSKILEPIRKVGKNGLGNVDAQKAWKQIANLSPSELPEVLAAMDASQPVISNWLRSAINAIVEKAGRESKTLPLDKITALVKDTSKPALGRKLAFEILQAADNDKAQALIPSFTNDPSAELRREAIALLIEEASSQKKGKKDNEAKATFRKAFMSASDKDQVDTIAKELKGLGETVDLPAHFGFVRTWYLVGPFDNTKNKGFDLPYPPEKEVKLDASYEGKEGSIKWVDVTTEDSYGIVDLNKVLGKKKDSTAYAFTRINSPADGIVYVRAGCITSLKIFHDGKQIFARDEYHHGMSMDQHSAPIHLKKGVNDILLKICQNNQTESWAQKWEFQVRLTDFAGVKIPYTIVKQEGSAK